MALYRLVAVIKNPSDEDFLVVRQAPPPQLPEEEYRSFVDSDLWDLPSAPLNPLRGDRRSETVVEGAYSLLDDDLDLEKFDVDSALDEEDWVKDGNTKGEGPLAASTVVSSASTLGDDGTGQV
ncbi:hypothetical protein B296_00006906 [Ensete ventricosum]|uniref:Uncharacterized protein n=1 Tax=Ensete ventricosum TaxID=4639 RepID=A0A427AFP8_ENSVE|nr:hypothetical protein B296_00006906 [Ensete ventricosum]